MTWMGFECGHCPVGLSVSVVVAVSVYAVSKLVSHLRLKSLMKNSLKNKVVCITGASSGIGSELARICFSLGAKVILVARREHVLQELKTELLNSRPNGSADGNKGRDNDIAVVAADLGKLYEVEEKSKDILDCFGRVDCLINNAGISCRGRVEDILIELHQKVMTVNYFSHIALVKAILPQMIAREQSRKEDNKCWIVGISSLQGKFSLPYRSAYGASKHANQAFYDSLRAEVESMHSNISVCLISPGYVKTQIAHNAYSSTGNVEGKADKSIEKGMSAEECARRTIEAMVSNKKDVCIAPWYHSILRFARVLLPSPFFKVMRSIGKAEHKEYSS